MSIQQTKKGWLCKIDLGHIVIGAYGKTRAQAYREALDIIPIHLMGEA